jgi:hypothetical protein
MATKAIASSRKRLSRIAQRRQSMMAHAASPTAPDHTHTASIVAAQARFAHPTSLWLQTTSSVQKRTAANADAR